ncbi:MAG: uL15 family ribosomal protein [Methanobacteriaceae archaeon]|nr:uL15 family ribosomal protein [Methanobacteriaceae archaeon]
MIRKQRKIRKLRGSRSVGGGCTKKRRGAGHKGGRGQAGGNKHHWTWMVINDPKHFGKYGFKRPSKTIQEFKSINLDYIDNELNKLLNNNIATKENDEIIIDVTKMGYNKVLGSGNLTNAMTIKSPKFSKKAVEKIEAIGGIAEIIE